MISLTQSFVAENCTLILVGKKLFPNVCRVSDLRIDSDG